jgi:hypothetical protein
MDLGALPLTGTKAEKSPYTALLIDPSSLVLRAQIALTCSRRRTQVEFALYQGMACPPQAGFRRTARKDLSDQGFSPPTARPQRLKPSYCRQWLGTAKAMP